VPAAAAVAAAVAGLAAACAPRPAPVAPGAPRYAEFVYPALPPDVAARGDAARHAAAWQALQAGDLRAAERGFAAILARAPAFYPAETGLGYVELARSEAARALAHFDAALAQAPHYAPALAGRGAALVLDNRVDEALASFEAALAADPSLAGVRRQMEILAFRRVEAEVARARQAAEARRYETAREAYERALARSPESGFLYRELAAVEQALGRLEVARAHARRAAELDPSDASAFATLGEVEAARGDYGAAVGAFERAYALDPSSTLAARLADVRERARLAALPPEFHAIARSPAVTRGELAALVAVRLDDLLERAPRREAVFISDTRGHWAAPYILTAARAGVMEVYPDYTFQPAQVVTRGELAEIVSRLLGLAAAAEPALAERWSHAAVPLADVPPGHLRYRAAAMAVASGVMPPVSGNLFQLARPVSGAEAESVIDRLRRLVGERR
jgi:tetratricopeptide (TPR) repeat protein